MALGVKGTRTEPTGDEPTEHGVQFQATMRW